MNKLIFHADDIGLSKNITRFILDTIDNGIISSVSIIINGFYSKEAAKEIQTREIIPFLHLNLTEGQPISNKKLVTKHLCDLNHNFNNSFLSFNLKWFFSRKKIKLEIENSIKNEIIAQIKEFKLLFPNIEKIKIDGHEHIHMSPIIFKNIIAISEELQITEMRLSRENISHSLFYVIYPKYYFNVIKVLILNFLSCIYLPKLKNRKIKYQKYFFGILFSGKMKKILIERIVKHNKNKNINILLHPGYSSIDEKYLWNNQKRWQYYNSKNRIVEYNLAKNKNLKINKEL